jgi:general nucleoside transport system ATP-binding protein
MADSFVIEMKKINKSFGPLKANDSVDFTLKKGEIHALLGENGAGKSTLMNILYGLYSRDDGEIEVNGRNAEINSPSDSIALGIGMVHQHFMLIPQLTVAQNIYLGLQNQTGFIIKRKAIEERVNSMSESFNFCLNAATPVWQLPVGLQQKVEILRLLTWNARILILDEPTAVLTPDEAEDLFVSLKKMAARGYSIILITHKLEEVFHHSDRVTVLRHGKLAGTLATKDTTKEKLAVMMVGRKVFFDQEKEKSAPGPVLLKVNNLHVRNDKGLPAVDGVSFSVHRGEIFGIAGVDGNGQLELGEALSGLRKIDSGAVHINNIDISAASPRERINQKISHIPDDRQRKGLVLGFSVAENLVLASHWKKPFNSGFRINRRYMKEQAQALVSMFDIRPPHTETAAVKLSGGNQQKVVLARELSRDPELVIGIQPTRGLDIGAIEFVWEKLLEERRKGKAILLISTDLDEIIHLSDRIGVMYKGEFTGIMTPDAPLETIGLCMTGCIDPEEKEQGCTDE